MSFSFDDDPFGEPGQPGREGPKPPAATTTGWGGQSGSPGVATVGGPPLPILYVAVACTVLAVAFSPWAPAPLVPGLTWLLAGPVAILLLGAFYSRDLQARATAVYQSPGWVAWATRLLVVLAILGVVISSYRLADWVSRR